jgi:hypothetical protein
MLLVLTQAGRRIRVGRFGVVVSIEGGLNEPLYDSFSEE